MTITDFSNSTWVEADGEAADAALICQRRLTDGLGLG